jgi:RNA polymerase sigma factor (TIGR02999 family)
LAAKIMRDVLVDFFRRQHASKRSGGRIEFALDDADGAYPAPQLDLLVLDDAIRKLGEIKSRYTDIVELRFFGGLTIEETAEALQVSHATVEREWNFARAWLRRELGTKSPAIK